MKHRINFLSAIVNVAFGLFRILPRGRQRTYSRKLRLARLDNERCAAACESCDVAATCYRRKKVESFFRQINTQRLSLPDVVVDPQNFVTKLQDYFPATISSHLTMM